MVAAGLAGCMAHNTRQLLGSVRSLESSIEESVRALEKSISRDVDRLSRVFTWGFSETLAALGGMQTTLQDLLKTAQTPAQTAAYEHFHIARDAFRKGLFPECLEALAQATDGVVGVSAGHKLEWRFHQLRGLVLLGSYENAEGPTVNPIEAEACFLKAARYAKADAPEDAAKALLSAGWAAYVQVDRADAPKLRQALEHTQRALELDPTLGEAQFQEAKFQMALGLASDGLKSLRRAADRGAVYLAKAAADGDFKRHRVELDRFLESMHQELIEQLGRELGGMVAAMKPIADELPSLKNHPAAIRVFDFGISLGAKGLLELLSYQQVGWPEDRKALEGFSSHLVRSSVKEWEETVTETVVTGEVDRVEESVQETYRDEVVHPGGWFSSDQKILVPKTRTKTVVREVPRIREVQRKVIRSQASVELFLVRGPDFKKFSVDISGISDSGIPLVSILPGKFRMGESVRQLEVTLDQPFWIAPTQCTQREWKAVMGGNPSYFKGENLPVENVSWEDAMDFCRRVTERERAAGRLPEGYEYTLPTEAQWEYACRAGTSGDCAGNLDEMAWYDANSGGTTHPVGQKKPNAWGLRDMHGNVWEWCLDWYGDYPEGSATDPKGPQSGTLRVVRGGGWCFSAGYCRSAYRDWFEPCVRNGYLGFRLALSSVRQA